MELEFRETVLFVSDIERSKKFYIDILLQEVTRVGTGHVIFESGLALWHSRNPYRPFSRESGRVRQAAEKEQKGPGMEIYFETDDIGTLAEQIYEAGVTMLQPMVEKPWGQRTLRFFDPDRHLIEVGEKMDIVVFREAASGMPAEMIAQKTYIPVQEVNRILMNKKD